MGCSLRKVGCNNQLYIWRPEFGLAICVTKKKNSQKEPMVSVFHNRSLPSYFNTYEVPNINVPNLISNTVRFMLNFYENDLFVFFLALTSVKHKIGVSITIIPVVLSQAYMVSLNECLEIQFYFFNYYFIKKNLLL